MRWPLRVPARMAFSALLLLGTAACDSPIRPEAGSTYVLTRIGDTPLPAVAMESEHVTLVVHADTLRFVDGNHGIQVRHEELTYAEEPGTTHTAKYEIEFAHRMRGSRLEISYVCGPLASCIPGPHLVGTMTDTAIRIVGGTLGVGDLVYERLAVQ